MTPEQIAGKLGVSPYLVTQILLDGLRPAASADPDRQREAGTRRTLER